MAKMYVGAQLRRLRENHGLNQTQLADRLGISPSYLNQLERSRRPLTVPVLLRITEVFGVDADFFAARDTAKLVADVRLVLQESTTGASVSAGDITELSTQFPEIAQTLVEFHQKHKDAVEQTALLLGGDAHSTASLFTPMPHEEVRDFFYSRGNYVAELDETAEAQAEAFNLTPETARQKLADELQRRHGIRTVTINDDGIQYRLDANRRVLYLAARLTPGQQSFRIAIQLGMLEQHDLITDIANKATFRSPNTHALVEIGLANYFASALVMPYTHMRRLAEEFQYDIERLSSYFGMGFEAICHRLSTLQRPRARGVPFSFVRVDKAGNISKRQSATDFHFSRAGGTCPLWNVYEAFTRPNRVLVQMASMPDNRRYLWIAKTVSYQHGGYGKPGKEFAVGLGCEIRHAPRLVYSHGLNTHSADAATPIGMGCKVCDRTGCAQRAFPPIGKQLHVDGHSSSFIPYSVVHRQPHEPS